MSRSVCAIPSLKRPKPVTITHRVRTSVVDHQQGHRGEENLQPVTASRPGEHGEQYIYRDLDH